MTPRDRAVLAARVGLPSATVAALLLTLISVCVGIPCVPLGLRYGMWPDRCPTSEMRLDASAVLTHSASSAGASTSGFAELTVSPVAHWLVDGQLERMSVRRGFSWKIELRRANGERLAQVETGRPRRSDDGLLLPLVLPNGLPDGDYVVWVALTVGSNHTEVEVPLPLYPPAIAHVLTDRPVYQPGQEVLVRSVLLSRETHLPVERRPGRWLLRDPDGVDLYSESSESGPWGVSHTTFPLDIDSRVGTWTVRFESGSAADEVQFDVRPFQLPRGVVDLVPSKSWYAIGDEVTIEGFARYASGAPMVGVPVRVSLGSVEGRWPVPLEWLEPHETITRADGRFRVRFGAVPADLVQRARYRAQAEVFDPAGTTLVGKADVLFSRDSLLIEAVTELGGLVQNVNNRVFLRVARPDGAPLVNTEVVVRRSFDAEDNGKRSVTDEDGVAAVQLEPGAPATVVIPAVPVRVPLIGGEPPVLVRASRLGGDNPEVSLDERRALDSLIPAISRCRQYSSGSEVHAALTVWPSGRVRSVMVEDDPLSACVGERLRTVLVPPGPPRTFDLTWNIPDGHLPTLEWSTQMAFGSEPPELFGRVSTAVRPCFRFSKGAVTNSPVVDVHWSVSTGLRRIRMSIVERPGHGLSAAALSCVRAEIERAALGRPAEAPAMGVTTGTLMLPTSTVAPVSAPTTVAAYELHVSASIGGAPAGTGKVVVPVGVVPPLRLRAEPPVVLPGQELDVDFVRGPGFRGELPTELVLTQGARELGNAKVHENRATFEVPADVRGFVEVRWLDVHASVFVRDPEPLAVELEVPDAVRPGDAATLRVTTRAGTAPVSAAVGLVGVDARLAALAPLPGPDDLGRVSVGGQYGPPVFGAFDGRALALGRVRGENAARAALLTVMSLAEDREGTSVRTRASTTADVDGELLSSFYRVLGRTTQKVRVWERTAPDQETLSYSQVVTFWQEALAELRQEGTPARDGYGRELELNILTPALLAQCDPHLLVLDGTRLPEDYQDWVVYVAEEVR